MHLTNRGLVAGPSAQAARWVRTHSPDACGQAPVKDPTCALARATRETVFDYRWPGKGCQKISSGAAAGYGKGAGRGPSAIRWAWPAQDRDQPDPTAAG